MENGFYTVIGQAEDLTVIEKSKFICYLRHVESEDEARRFISEIKKKNSLATHNCYAYICDKTGINQKCSDDGEPQGTAGVPMLEVLKGKRLFCTCAVVTRYFGGIKLGKGGLSRAYSNAVSECVVKSKVAELIFSDFFKIKTDYETYNKALSVIGKGGITVISTDYSGDITLTVVCPVDISDREIDRIKEATSGKVGIEKLKRDYYGY